jgi:DNA-binding NarL/FixJ family response regulator
MPELSATQVAKVLRRIVPETRIVVLSGTSPARAAELLRLGVHGYLCKPVQGRELTDTTRAVCTGAVRFDPDIARLLAADTWRVARAAPTPRERDVLRLVADGLHNHEIAVRLCVSGDTVEFHLKQLYAKLRAASRVELVRLAEQHGWVA